MKRVDRDIKTEDITEEYVLNFKLSAFQKWTMKFIYEIRIASTEQIASVMGVSYSYARGELSKLYKGAFLWKTVKDEVSFGVGKNEMYWMLDYAGAMYIAGANDMKLKDLNWNMRDNLIALDKLKHSLKITEVFTTLDRAAKENNHKIEGGLCDRHLFYKFSIQQDTKPIILRPDLQVLYIKDNRIYTYFFEIDMGTMAINGPAYRTSNVASKVPKYEAFKQSGEWREYFDVFPRVIFLTTTKTRAQYMADSISKIVEKNNVEFLFSTFEFLEADALGRIFKKLDGEVTDLFN